MCDGKRIIYGPRVGKNATSLYLLLKLINFMERSPSREDKPQAGKKFVVVYGTWNFLFMVTRISLFDPILWKLNAVHSSTFYVFVTRFNIIPHLCQSLSYSLFVSRLLTTIVNVCNFHQYMLILYKIRRKDNWIGNILRRNCLLKHIIEEKIDGGIQVT